MFRKAIKATLLAAGISLAVACGGNEAESRPPENQQQDRTTAGAAPAATVNAVPAPTRPQRMDFLLTPTVEPAKTPAPAPEAGSQTGSSPALRPEAGSTETATGSAAAPTTNMITKEELQALLAQDFRFSEQILLQDVYSQMELEQFALHPDEPIEYEPDATRNEFDILMLSQHPHLHLFPNLRRWTEQQIEWVEKGKQADPYYYPTDHWTSKPKNRFLRLASDTYSLSSESGDFFNQITHFIYNPWWESFFPNLIRDRFKKDLAGPYHFGNDSLRGVLAETVADLIREASLPGAKPEPRAWAIEDIGYDSGLVAEERGRGNQNWGNKDWELEEFISTQINPKGIRYDRLEMHCRATTRYDPCFKEGFIGETKSHLLPSVEWEILHPQLPIIRITAHAVHGLPLIVGEETSRWSHVTKYSVSFVMSFQNRWASFQDPNRWIIRFRDELEAALGERTPYNDNYNHVYSPHGLDPELPYPNYWDDTDYMHHRIIGPVVMTVHESEVLKPGNYSMRPRINQWAAPGPILTDQQVPTVIVGRTRSRPGKEILRTWIALKDPNAGFPFPGHVMTNPSTGPGTDAWREKGMDGYGE